MVVVVWTVAGLLHTILFNRALNPTKAKEADCDVFDITYVRCPV